MFEKWLWVEKLHHHILFLVDKEPAILVALFLYLVLVFLKLHSNSNLKGNHPWLLLLIQSPFSELGKKSFLRYSSSQMCGWKRSLSTRQGHNLKAEWRCWRVMVPNRCSVDTISGLVFMMRSVRWEWTGCNPKVNPFRPEAACEFQSGHWRGFSL